MVGLEHEVVSIRTIRQAVESGHGTSTKFAYLAHPLTTGGQTVAKNTRIARIRSLALRASLMREGSPLAVMNPTAIGLIPGWSQDTWMDLWLPFIKERVGLLVRAPDWRRSKGCTLEVGCALSCDIPVVDLFRLTGMVTSRGGVHG